MRKTCSYAVFGREEITPPDELLDRYLKFGCLPYLAISGLPDYLYPPHTATTPHGAVRVNR